MHQPVPKWTGCFFMLFGTAFLPLLLIHFRQLWQFQHYQFFPWVVIGIAVLLGMEIHGNAGHTVAHSPSIPGLEGTISWILLAVATIAWSPNIAAAAFVVAVIALLNQQKRLGRIGRVWPYGLALLTLVKLPLNLDVELIFFLQGATSKFASAFLDALSINHVLQGHVIRIAGEGFLVEEACSGVQSLFTLFAGTAVALIAVQRKSFHSLLLLAGAVLWACLLNVGRVASVVIASVWFDLNIASGTPHEILGLLLFAVAIAMLVSTDSLLLCALGRSNATSAHSLNGDVKDSPRSPVPKTVGAGSMFGLAAFAFLGLLQLVIVLLQQKAGDAINPDDPRIAAALTEDTLAEQIGDWKRTNFAQTTRSAVSYMGRNSISWTYERGGEAVVISVDYPFLGWHELENCYRAQGCVVSERRLAPEEPGLHAVECLVSSPAGAFSQLWYSQFTNSGHPLTPLSNGAGSFQYWLSRLQSSFLRQAAVFESNPGNYQVQMLAHRDGELSQQQRTELLALHRFTAEILVTRIRKATE